MKIELLKLWDRVHTSYWFLPAFMVLLVIALAALTLHFDTLYSGQIRDVLWVYGGSADGGRQLLSTLAAATITVAGTVFSIMIVALSLASQQFGPRLLRNFLNDTGIQLVIGTFIATFIFDLLVLGQVKEFPSGVAFVPRLSITASVIMAMISFGVLIYFIHHMSHAIHVDHLITRVSHELQQETDRLYPERIEPDNVAAPPEPPPLPEDFAERAAELHVPHSGYLETLATDDLLKAATQHDLLLVLAYRPGHYLTSGDVLLRVYPPERADEHTRRRLHKAFSISAQRTPTQDVEFSIYQLVEIACRALSPGVNDPFTAVSCVDYLSTAMCRLLGRTIPPPYCYDGEGRLRIVMPQISSVGMIDAAFDQVRQSAADNVAVSLRLLESLGRMSAFVRREEDRLAIIRHAGAIRHTIASHTQEATDLHAIEDRYQDVLQRLRTRNLNGEGPARDGA